MPDDAITPFTIDVDEAVLDDLRRRLHDTRWPERETGRRLVTGHPARLRPGRLRVLGRRVRLARRERPPSTGSTQFTTTIDGLDIHFIHVRSPHEDAVPLLITHGWPGSIVEFHKVIEPLTEPDRVRRRRGRRVPRRRAVAARLRLLGQADRDRLGRAQDRRGVRHADGPSRLRPLRRPGRRLGIGGHHGDRCDRHRPLRRHPRDAGDGRSPEDRRRPDARGAAGGRRRRPITGIGTRATRSSRARGRRPSATASSTHRRRRRRGSSRSSGPGPTATGTPRTC